MSDSYEGGINSYAIICSSFASHTHLPLANADDHDHDGTKTLLTLLIHLTILHRHHLLPSCDNQDGT